MCPNVGHRLYICGNVHISALNVIYSACKIHAAHFAKCFKYFINNQINLDLKFTYFYC